MGGVASLRVATWRNAVRYCWPLASQGTAGRAAGPRRGCSTQRDSATPTADPLGDTANGPWKLCVLSQHLKEPLVSDFEGATGRGRAGGKVRSWCGLADVDVQSNRVSWITHCRIMTPHLLVGFRSSADSNADVASLAWIQNDRFGVRHCATGRRIHQRTHGAAVLCASRTTADCQYASLSLLLFYPGLYLPPFCYLVYLLVQILLYLS